MCALRQNGPEAVILAVPVAPQTGLQALEAQADRLIAVERSAAFYAVGVHYHNFAQVSDQDVIEYLSQASG